MIDKDVEDDSEDNEQALPADTKKHLGLFGATGIQLNDEELRSSATTKFLRHLISQQENEIQKLKSYEAQYYDKRQECEVLKKEKSGIEKELEAKKTAENLQKVMITSGSVVLGAMKFFEDAAWYVLLLMAIVSVLLIVGGMFPVLRIGASK